MADPLRIKPTRSTGDDRLRLAELDTAAQTPDPRTSALFFVLAYDQSLLLPRAANAIAPKRETKSQD